MKCQKIYVMIGPPGSGKSTYARKLAKKRKTKWISSDEIRLLYHYSLSQVKETFTVYYDEMTEYLKKGWNVVLDSTNISLWHRKHIFEILESEFKEAYILGKIKVIAIICNRTKEECITQLEERNKTNYPYKIPVSAIGNYINKFQMPLLSEGFTSRKLLHKPSRKNKKDLARNISLLEQLRHNDSYHGNESYLAHVENVKLHSEQFLLYAASTFGYLYDPHHDERLLNKTIYLHDYGKLLTMKTNPDTGKISYPCHANVGAWDYIARKSTKQFTKESFLIFIMNYHMMLLDERLSNNSVNEEVLIKRLGSPDLFTLLELFDIADKEMYEHRDEQIQDN